jgi:hypothetical protein
MLYLPKAMSILRFYRDLMMHQTYIKKNLLSISVIANKGHIVVFGKSHCSIKRKDNFEVVVTSTIDNNNWLKNIYFQVVNECLYVNTL